MPDRIGRPLVKDAPTVGASDRVADAVQALASSGLPAVPVVDDRGRLCGIFGEREFIGALFPGYLDTLGYAGFVPKSLDKDIDRRLGCTAEPVSKYMNREHIDVPVEFSDVQLAETFLHHRVLIVPVVDDGRVAGVVTRSDFFRALAERMDEGPQPPG